LTPASPAEYGSATWLLKQQHGSHTVIFAVNRAMAMIEALADEPHGATLMQLVQRVGVEKSVASRVIATLEEDGYLVRDPITGLIRISLRFTAMALRQIERTGLIEMCQPVLNNIAEETGELVQLALVTGSGLTYVAKAVGARRIQAQPLIGTRAVLHASAAGKLWLASQSEEAALKAALDAGLTRFTQHTIVTAQKLSAEIRQVRSQGYALLEQELSEDMNALGVPLKHPRDSRMLGAILVGAPAYRMQRKVMLKLVPKLSTWANQLSGIVAVAGEPPAVRSAASNQVPS
jgi:IclR family acetate operon transcriptional repressor